MDDEPGTLRASARKPGAPPARASESTKSRIGGFACPRLSGRAATALYLRAAQNAFREVADALVDVAKFQEIRAAAERQVVELREA